MRAGHCRAVDADHSLLAAFRGKGPFIHRDEPYCFTGPYAKLNFRPLLSLDVKGLKDPKGEVGKMVRYVAWIKPYGHFVRPAISPRATKAPRSCGFCWTASNMPAAI